MNSKCTKNNFKVGKDSSDIAISSCYHKMSTISENLGYQNYDKLSDRHLQVYSGKSL